MKIVNAKRMVVITEASIEKDILKIIDDCGAKGYTIARDIVGRGTHGVRFHSYPMSKVGHNVKIESILVTEEKAVDIMNVIIDKYFSHNYAGLVYMHDVQTLKNEQL